MFDWPANIETLELPAGKRVLAISDIHGNIPYFKGLLNKLGFCGDDELIIVGDFLEKGADSLGTLRYIMELSQQGNVHTVCGNCDDWFGIYLVPHDNSHLLHYMRWKKSGLLWEMCVAQGIDPLEIEDFTPVKALLKTAFSAEWDFLSAMPNAVETERYIFAHAAVNPTKPLREHTAGELMRFDRFMDMGLHFGKWVVVGHTPVMLYGTDKVCANPVIDREHHLISIDGGCVLKDDGQLNALIIPDVRKDDFSFDHYDRFPERRVLSDQKESEHSYYIRWGDSNVQVLSRGVEFSHCRHVRTGYEMDILTKYLFNDSAFTGCNDCTDYILPLKKGDMVSVVEETSRGYFVKHNGYSGWYYGELE